MTRDGNSGSTTSGTGWTTGWQRLSQTFLRPAPPPLGSPGRLPDFSRMNDEEKRAYITRVDSTERKIGLVAAVVGVALALYANVPYMVSRIAVVSTVKPHTKAPYCPSGYTHAVTAGKGVCKTVYPAGHYVLPLVVSLVLAAAIYVTVRINRRAPLAFTIVLNGLAFGSLLVLVPYAVGGGWIMLRAWRTQRYGAPTAKAPVEGWVPPPPRSRMSARRPRSTGPATTRSGPSKGRAQPAAGTRKPPSANKRYTPKAPPPTSKKAPPNPRKKVTPPS